MYHSADRRNVAGEDSAVRLSQPHVHTGLSKDSSRSRYGQITFNRRSLGVFPRYLDSSYQPYQQTPTYPANAYANSQMPSQGVVHSRLDGAVSPTDPLQAKPIHVLPIQRDQVEPDQANSSSLPHTPAPAPAPTPVASQPATPVVVPTPVVHSHDAASPPAEQATPSPVPVVHHGFNLVNSSLVISVATPSFDSNAPASEPPTPAATHHPHYSDKNANNKSSGMPLPFLIAIVLPAVFLIVLAAAMIQRCIQKRKCDREFAECPFPSRKPPPVPLTATAKSQAFSSDVMSTSEGMSSMAEKKRLSYSSNATSARAEDDVKIHNINLKPSTSYADLPPLPLASPFTYDMITGATDGDSSPPPNLLPTSEGIPCKKSCTIIRTFVRSLPDELMIGIGDRVIVYLLFDDGWCLGDNLDIEKHQPAEGDKYSRVGVLPQECLSGLDRKSGENPSRQSSLMAAIPASDELNSKHGHGTVNLEALAEDERSNPCSHPLLPPFHKPQRASSLLLDREANLFRELEHALAFVT